MMTDEMAIQSNEVKLNLQRINSDLKIKIDLLTDFNPSANLNELQKNLQKYLSNKSELQDAHEQMKKLHTILKELNEKNKRMQKMLENERERLNRYTANLKNVNMYKIFWNSLGISTSFESEADDNQVYKFRFHSLLGQSADCQECVVRVLNKDNNFEVIDVQPNKLSNIVQNACEKHNSQNGDFKHPLVAIYEALNHL